MFLLYYYCCGVTLVWDTVTGDSGQWQSDVVKYLFCIIVDPLDKRFLKIGRIFFVVRLERMRVRDGLMTDCWANTCPDAASNAADASHQDAWRSERGRRYCRGISGKRRDVQK